MAKDNWSEEETRIFFQLYADERRNGNRTSVGMNKTGKENIMKKFEERCKRGYNKWNPFKNKYDACKKKYPSFRMLTHNRPELQYDEMGRLEMPDDWWKQRIEFVSVSYSLYGVILSEANLKAYMDHDIVICTQGAEGERFHGMLLRILLSAMDRERVQYNFLILSPNKDFAQCTKLSEVSLSLREMGIHIAVAHPDLFKDFECPEWDLCCC